MLVKLAQMLYAKVVGCFMGNPNNMGLGGSISPPVRGMRPKSGQKWRFALYTLNLFPEKQGNGHFLMEIFGRFFF